MNLRDSIRSQFSLWPINMIFNSFVQQSSTNIWLCPCVVCVVSKIIFNAANCFTTSLDYIGKHQTFAHFKTYLFLCGGSFPAWILVRRFSWEAILLEFSIIIISFFYPFPSLRSLLLCVCILQGMGVADDSLQYARQTLAECRKSCRVSNQLLVTTLSPAQAGLTKPYVLTYYTSHTMSVHQSIHLYIGSSGCICSFAQTQHTCLLLCLGSSVHQFI